MNYGRRQLSGPDKSRGSVSALGPAPVLPHGGSEILDSVCMMTAPGLSSQLLSLLFLHSHIHSCPIASKGSE